MTTLLLAPALVLMVIAVGLAYVVYCGLSRAGQHESEQS